MRDAAYRRVKIKSAAYLMIDRVLCSLSTPRRKVEAVLSEGFDDMIPHLPDTVRDELFGIQAQIAEFRGRVEETFEALHQPERAAAVCGGSPDLSVFGRCCSGSTAAWTWTSAFATCTRTAWWNGWD